MNSGNHLSSITLHPYGYRIVCGEKSPNPYVGGTSYGSDIFFLRLCPLLLLRDVIVIINDEWNKSLFGGLV